MDGIKSQGFESQSEPITVILQRPTPLFVPVKEAAKIAGVSESMMYEAVDRSIDPIPHIKTSSKRNAKTLVRVASIQSYLDKMCLGEIV